MDMDMGASAAAPPGMIPHPDHGTWEGHILPGTFFILWSSWWLFSNFRLVCRDCALDFQLHQMQWQEVICTTASSTRLIL